MSLAAGVLMPRVPFSCLVQFAMTVVISGCGDDPTVDDFWTETTPDDEAAQAEPGVAAAPGARVDVHPGLLDEAERVKLLPVGRSESGATRRIAMQLRPGQLPSLASGDRLITPAEVQVTTRCDIGQTAPGCNYNPYVRAQLILTGNPDDTRADGAGSRALATDMQSCNKSEHHCMFVFGPGQTATELGDLPCLATNSCYVNLVMWAWHPDARSGDQDGVLVGGNDGNYLDNGRVEGDQGRLMVVRERNVTAADRIARESSGSGSIGVNTAANPVLVYSHRLKAAGQRLVAGEQFLVEAKLVATVSSRARFSTEMFLTRDPVAKDGNGIDRISPSQIGEHNGVNCTPGDPCVTRKVSVFRVDASIDDAVYVNVVVKSAVPGGGGANVTVKRDDGWVRSVRYGAQLGL